LTLRALRQVPGGWFWRTDPRLKAASTYRLTEAIVVNYLQGIRVPTLLVGADAGYFGRGELLTQRAQQVADIAIVALPGGHHFHLEVDTAPAVGAVTADFFAKQLAKQLT
jgi:predicted alpha/beta-hydrolase family hydrolase